MRLGGGGIVKASRVESLGEPTASYGEERERSCFILLHLDMVVGSRTSMSWPGEISNATTDRDSSLVLQVGDEQRSGTYGHPQVTFEALLLHTHPLGVTTWVIATKSPGVNQPSFAGMLGWALQLNSSTNAARNMWCFFVSSANNLDLGSLQAP